MTADATGAMVSTRGANWQPSDTATIREWVSRVDGNGGFSVIESDSAEDILKDLATWSSFLDFQVYPVVDIADATPTGRRSPLSC